MQNYNMSKKLRYFVFSQKKDKTLTMNQFEKVCRKSVNPQRVQLLFYDDATKLLHLISIIYLSYIFWGGLSIRKLHWQTAKLSNYWYQKFTKWLHIFKEHKDILKDTKNYCTAEICFETKLNCFAYLRNKCGQRLLGAGWLFASSYVQESLRAHDY